jgi:hydroxyacyl-ACP dehydratase HTD2-like protein with hotdog domain
VTVAAPTPASPGTGAAAAGDWSAWIGRRVHDRLRATADTVALLEATLDRPPPAPGDPLAPLRHWLWMFAPPATQTGALGPDGHAPRGELIPNWPLPRRMWGGSSVRWLAPIPIDGPLEHEATIESVDVKRGRSGTLGFVVLRHRWLASGVCAIDETQTVVYREAAPADAPAAPAAPATARVEAPGPAPVPAQSVPATGGWQVPHVPTEALLFRYSAVTFNTHRIHYDAGYATREEGYPGLIVHGPLMATLMLDAFRDAHPGARVLQLDFRALQPAFVGNRLSIGGEPAGPGQARVWVRGADGATHLSGEVRFEG